MDQKSLQVASATDTGLVRRKNEDSLSIMLDEGLVILADGMGGKNAGDIASRLAVDVMSETMRAQLAAIPINERYKGCGKTNAIEMLKISLDFTNNIVHSTSKQFEQCSGMGTTLITCLFFKDYVAISNVGDSRVYRAREKEVTQLTHDHSYFKNDLKYLTKAVGVGTTVNGDATTYLIEVGDLYLICSDGLTDMVTFDELYSLLVNDNVTLNDLCSLLVQAAKDGGGKDNITVILVKVVG
jgi:serine/threonine protein phosphatase PrpC